ncbi:energy transducer TonB [Labrenzia sp. OB1]|uniref:energy transducer TonB family protein n=1 Tax=Labrenzia sp. OB1 TaxID=1561204 RepID=UPI00083997F6|nr:energy transducer TonB [Labrenzia sp. OB1]
MKTFRKPLIIALAASLAIHLIAVAMTLQSRPDLEIEGAGEVLHAVLGQSPFHTLVAGTTAQSEIQKPVEDHEVQTPVEPEQAIAKPVETAKAARVEPLEPVQRTQPVTTQTVEAATEVQPVETAVSASLPVSPNSTLAIPVTHEQQPESPVAVQQVEKVEIAEAESIKSQQAPIQPEKPVLAAAVPVQTNASEAPPPEKATEVRSEEVLKAETDAPAPRSKPEPPKKNAKAEPAKTRPATTKKPVKPLPRAEQATKSGAGGQSNQTTQKGGSQRKGKSKTAGNSDVTNYPAKVHRKILRSLRAPKGGRRAKGEAKVRFTVRKNGSVGSVRLASSSGSKPFDQAVLKAVSRAAPFPPIPGAAGRSSWTFTLPVAMR